MSRDDERNKRVHVTISIPGRLREDVYVVKEYFWLYYGERITWERIIREGIDALLSKRGLNLEAVRKEITEIEEAKKKLGLDE